MHLLIRRRPVELALVVLDVSVERGDRRIDQPGHIAHLLSVVGLGQMLRPRSCPKLIDRNGCRLRTRPRTQWVPATERSLAGSPAGRRLASPGRGRLPATARREKE